MYLAGLHKWLNYGIAIIWLINGLYCKLLNAVPRHKAIVARILGTEHAEIFTILIGTGEVCIALWILSNCYKRQATYFQVVTVVLMNILEFILAPDLLLWGRANLFFSLLLAALIYWNNMYLQEPKKKEGICPAS